MYVCVTIVGGVQCRAGEKVEWQQLPPCVPIPWGQKRAGSQYICTKSGSIHLHRLCVHYCQKVRCSETVGLVTSRS